MSIETLMAVGGSMDGRLITFHSDIQKLQIPVPPDPPQLWWTQDVGLDKVETQIYTRVTYRYKLGDDVCKISFLRWTEITEPDAIRKLIDNYKPEEES